MTHWSDQWTRGGPWGAQDSWLVAPSLPRFLTLPHLSLQMAVIGQQAGGSSNLTELQVVNLDAAHSTKND